MHVDESFNDDKHSLNGSVEDVNFNRRNFSDYQDDRKIVKQAALNDKYKLVERPRFLFSFENYTWEAKFATWVFRKHFITEFYTYVMKSVFDVVLVQAFIVANNKFNAVWFNLLVGLTMCAFDIIMMFALFRRKVKKPRYITFQFFSYYVSFALIIAIGPEVSNLIYREAIEVTFAMYMMLAFLTRSL